jgi:hypothetical protein
MNTFAATSCCIDSARPWNTVSMPASFAIEGESNTIGESSDVSSSRLVAHVELSAGHGNHAREQVDERGFPRTIVANDSENLILPHGEVHVLECDDASVVLRDAFRGEEYVVVLYRAGGDVARRGW